MGMIFQCRNKPHPSGIAQGAAAPPPPRLLFQLLGLRCLCLGCKLMETI